MRDQAIWEIPQRPQRKDSLNDQLRDVHRAANRLGCFDAADAIWKLMRRPRPLPHPVPGPKHD